MNTRAEDLSRSKSSGGTDAPPPLARFIVICIELALVLAAAHAFGIERNHGLPAILPLIFAGFIVHAWLPRRYRPALFLLVSLASIVMVLGPVGSLALVSIGAVLIACCHLPIAFRARIALLIGAGAVLAAFRVEWLTLPGFGQLSSMVIPLLAAMFMFRIAIYMYDLRHARERPPVVHRLGYFFLLPNACFPLFPVIDFSAFGRNYYNAPAVEIYQKGVRWFMRGVVHLMLYRLIYYHFTPAFDDIRDLTSVVEYVVSSYLLYLRVSGMFHIVVGVLCLFGYNLPETHRLYFLASSFTDFWRRINIYWKDFMMKILYYPMFTRLKSRGVTTAMVIATLATLVGSWILHSYQIFWLRGSFPLIIQDAVFWGVLGVAVAVNSVLEFSRGRHRGSAASGWSTRAAFVLSLKTVAMFCFMCLLWSFWTSHSVAEWLAVMRVARQASPVEFLALGAAVAAIVVVGALVQLVHRHGWVITGETQPPFVRSVTVTALLAAAAILFAYPPVRDRLAPKAQTIIASLQANRPNLRDEEMVTRGYYEELLGAERIGHAVWNVGNQKPKDWVSLRGSGATRDTSDLRLYELLPDVNMQFKRAPFLTNRLGMRDKEYALEKPRCTCRIALFGASYTMGAGVANEAVYEALLETRLNRERPLAACHRYEILNFATGGYSAMQSAMTARERIPQFMPDAVMYVTAHDDQQWVVTRTAMALSEGVPIDEPFFRGVAERAGLIGELDQVKLSERLKPVAAELLSWAYRTIAEAADAAGARPIWVFLPRYDRAAFTERARHGRLAPVAREAGFTALTLDGVYDGHDNRELRLASWDTHLSAIGHELVAARLFEVMAADWALLRPGRQDDGDCPVDMQK